MLGRATRTSSDETATPNMASSTFVSQHTIPSRHPAPPFSGRSVRHTPRRENLSCPSSGISSGISSAFSSADELPEREDQNRFVRNTDTITPLTDAHVTNAQVTDAQVTDAQVRDAPVTKAFDKKDAKNWQERRGKCTGKKRKIDRKDAKNRQERREKLTGKKLKIYRKDAKNLQERREKLTGKKLKIYRKDAKNLQERRKKIYRKDAKYWQESWNQYFWLGIDHEL
jgi:hypothetical protein